MVKKRNTVALKIAVFVCIIFILFTFFYSGRGLNVTISSQVLSMIDELAMQQQFSFSEEIKTEMSMLTGLALNTHALLDDREAAVEYLSLIEDEHILSHPLLVNSLGLGVMADGTAVSISSTEYFIEAMQGQPHITEPIESPIAGESAVMLSTPVMDGDKVVGVLAAQYPITYLNSMLLPTFEGRGFTFVVNGSGEIIANTRNNLIGSETQFFEIIQTATFHDGSDADDLETAFRFRQAGDFEVTTGDLHWVGRHVPITINDWSIVLGVPWEVITDESEGLTQSVTVLSMVVFVLLLGMLLAIVMLRRGSIKDIERVAYYDELTGLPNLVYFKMLIARELKRNPDKRYTIVKIDIVNFKAINEMYSFDMGNRVIKLMAEIGERVTDPDFMQARIDADEFLLFSSYEYFEMLHEGRHNHERMFHEHMTEISKHHFNFNYGRYVIEPGDTDVNAIVDRVSLAHSHAKNQRNNPICDYDNRFKERVLRMTEISNKMDGALENDEFRLFLQPKYDIAKNKVVGAEALVRWIEEDGKLIYPNDFIPVFEQNGFITRLDVNMLMLVCKFLRSRIEKGLPIVPISVNFSRLHFLSDDFVDQLVRVVDLYGVPREYIEIELTETTILGHEELLDAMFKRMHALGLRMSMDDFGSGYSSLGLLKNLEVDVIKLDRSFFADCDDARRGNLVVRSMVYMAQALGIETVAEGVETKEQVEFLRSVGCDVAQGYYYAKPMPPSDFEALIDEELEDT